MNIQEASIEMEKLMNGRTFCCSQDIWNKGNSNGGCVIFFGFERKDLVGIKKDTFDKCIEEVKHILNIRNLLFRKF